MKKIVIFLSLVLIMILGIQMYKHYNRTVECWWGVMYPSLSYIAFEDEDEPSTRISSLDTEYIYINSNDDTEIKHKIWIVEWFNKFFRS